MSGPAFQLLPRSDLYNFGCSQVKGNLTCDATVYGREQLDRDGLNQSDTFGAFSINRLEGGTVGVRVKQGTEAYLRNWLVTGASDAAPPPKPKE